MKWKGWPNILSKSNAFTRRLPWPKLGEKPARRERLPGEPRYRWQESRAAAWLYHKRIYFFAFLIPALLMFCVYAAFGVYPFGDNSVLVLDLNGQYIYYYEAFRDALFGDHSMFYSWSRILGGELAGVYAYYLASPFSLIYCLFPKEMILEGVLVMQLFKLGASGVTFAWYLKHSRKAGDANALIFSILYAMMAYAVVQLMDPMWLDGLIYLPLIIRGTEIAIDDGEVFPMAVPLALMFFANYYIGWMVGFFTALYFVYYITFARKDESTTLKQDLFTCLKFGIGVLIAIAAAAVVLLPTYESLKLGKLEFTHPDYTLKPQFVLFDFFSKLLPESYDTVRNEGLPMVYCGVLTIMLAPLYFVNNNIRNKKKFGNGCLLVAVLLSMYLSTVDLAWHGFQVPNWLPYRYSFVFSFVLLTMASEAFERMEGVSYRYIGAVCAGLIIYILYLDTLKKDNLKTAGAIWFSLICVAVFALLLDYYKRHNGAKAAPIMLLVMISAELFAGGLETLKAIDKDVVYSKHSSYIPYIQTNRKLIEDMEKMDNSFYRMEKTYHRTVNDAMATHMRGMTHSSSALNAGPIALMDKLGLVSRGHYVKYKGSTLFTDALFGIKYIATKEIPVQYDKLVKQEGDIKVFENPNALSIGFMADAGVKDLELIKDNPFVAQNELLSALLSDTYVEYFRPVTLENTQYENLELSTYADHTHYKVITEGKNAQIEFSLTAPNDSLMYLYFPSTWENTMNVWINGEFLEPYYETDNYSIKTMGRFTPGQALNVVCTLTKEQLYMRDQWFYYLDEDMLNSALANLQQRQWNITRYSDTHLEGQVEAGDGQVLFTTIPYEPGWTVKVDGQEVEPIKLAGALLGVELSPGSHTVTMDFVPAGFTVGLCVTIAGLIMLAALAVYERKTRRVLLNRLYD